MGVWIRMRKNKRMRKRIGARMGMWVRIKY